MNYQFILHEIKDGVARIALNRPDVLNSFNREMAQEVQHALDAAGENPEVRAIYFTAEGRAFCAGQDLAEAIAEGAPDIAEIVETTYNPIVRKIRGIEKPVICAVNGVAAGAGANLAICCDITFAAKSANFIQSFANISLIPDSGGTFFLPRLVGLQKATEMMFTARKVSAEEAAGIGMICHAVEDEELHEKAWAMAAKLAKMPTKGFGLTKRLLNQSATNSIEAQLEAEKVVQAEAGKTKDNQEGINAFLEKRRPVFIGE